MSFARLGWLLQRVVSKDTLGWRMGSASLHLEKVLSNSKRLLKRSVGPVKRSIVLQAGFQDSYVCSLSFDKLTDFSDFGPILYAKPIRIDYLVNGYMVQRFGCPA